MNARALTAADDRDLLVAIQRRNAPAFEVIYRRYAVPVHAIVYRILGDAAMTDEVTNGRGRANLVKRSRRDVGNQRRRAAPI